VLSSFQEQKAYQSGKWKNIFRTGTVLEDHTILCPGKKVLADSLMYEIR
jgi:hypothetical protein